MPLNPTGAQPVRLPVLELCQGVATGIEITVTEDDGSPVDLAGWTAEVRIGRIGSEPLYTAPATITGGTVAHEVPADATAAMPASGRPVEVFQIAMTAPDETDNQVWQGPCIIFGRL
jgi:hypothetical protein